MEKDMWLILKCVGVLSGHGKAFLTVFNGFRNYENAVLLIAIRSDSN